MAKKLIDLYRDSSGLYGITKYYNTIKLKLGDKFILNGHKYRVGHLDNYFSDIPWWEYFLVTRKLADLFIGKRNYDY